METNWTNYFGFYNSEINRTFVDKNYVVQSEKFQVQI